MIAHHFPQRQHLATPVQEPHGRLDDLVADGEEGVAGEEVGVAVAGGSLLLRGEQTSLWTCTPWRSSTARNASRSPAQRACRSGAKSFMSPPPTISFRLSAERNLMSSDDMVDAGMDTSL
ncbi:hypothetical protein [Streptomyces sp. TE4109]